MSIALRCLLALACMSSSTAASDRESMVAVATWTVVVDGAIPIDGQPAPAVRLLLRRGPGGWWPVLGDAPDHNKAVLTGAVEPEDGGLTVVMHLPGDAWVRGGRGMLRLPSADGGPTAGTWSGTWNGVAVTGAVTVETWTAAAAAVPRAEPVAQRPPRLLAAAASAAPGVLDARTAGDDPLALGLLAAGDAALHQRAWPRIARTMADRNAGGGPQQRGYPWGDRVRLLALCYDLHARGLPAEQEQELRQWLSSYGERTLLRPWTVSDRSSWAPDGRHHAQLRGAGALAALALAGLPGPAPRPPAEPVAMAMRIPADGAADARPVPAGHAASAWRLAGPLAVDWVPGADDLAHLAAGGGSLPLRALRDKELSRGDDGQVRFIDLGTATGRAYGQGWCLVTAIELAEPLRGLWQLNAMNARARTWISGREVADGQPVELAAGRHSLVVVATFGTTPNTWDGIRLLPLVQAMGADELTAHLAEEEAGHRLARAVHAAALRQHADSGGADLVATDRLAVARLLARDWLHLGLGGGALAVEGDAALYGSARAMLEFEILHRARFGAGLAMADGAPRLLARAAALEIAGRPVRAAGFALGGEPMPPAIAARAWVLADETDRAAAAGLASRLLAPEALADDPLGRVWSAGIGSTTGRAPLGWLATGPGAVFFRNRHRDGDDIVVGITAHARASGAAFTQPEAGGLCLLGHGADWLDADRGDYNLVRPLEAVVVLPDGAGADAAHGRLLAHRLDPDGGGEALIDLSRTLLTLPGHGYGRRPDTADRLGRPLPQPEAPAGVEHRRALAVCWDGDAALILLRDRLRGAPAAPVWTLPTAATTAVAIGVDGRGFGWTAGNGRLDGVILGDGRDLRHGSIAIERQHYQRRSTTEVSAVRFDLDRDAEAVVLLHLAPAASAPPQCVRDGERILVDGRHRFTLREDGGIDRR